MAKAVRDLLEAFIMCFTRCYLRLWLCLWEGEGGMEGRGWRDESERESGAEVTSSVNLEASRGDEFNGDSLSTPHPAPRPAPAHPPPEKL